LKSPPCAPTCQPRKKCQVRHKSYSPRRNQRHDMLPSLLVGTPQTIPCWRTRGNGNLRNPLRHTGSEKPHAPISQEPHRSNNQLRDARLKLARYASQDEVGPDSPKSARTQTEDGIIHAKLIYDSARRRELESPQTAHGYSHLNLVASERPKYNRQVSVPINAQIVHCN